MPTAQMLTEEALPKYKEGEQDKERIKTLYNYLFMLVEQLRYSLGNISADNFNETALKELETDISAPIVRRVEDAEGNISTLTQSAGLISARLESAEGSVSSLALTAESLSSRITSAEGSVSNLTQTANSLSSRISNAEGDISSLTQTAGSLSSRITSAEGSISSLTQTANSLSSRIESVDGSVSSLSQTVNGLRLSVTNGESSSTISLVKDGAAVSSETISLKGYVTFSALSGSGQSTINGDNITTGNINVDLISPNNGVAIVFSHAIGASSGAFKRIDFTEGVNIGLGSNSGDSDVSSSYPNSIYYHGTSIFSDVPLARVYKSGSGYGLYPLLTAANIADEVEGLPAVFG